MVYSHKLNLWFLQFVLSCVSAIINDANLKYEVYDMNPKCSISVQKLSFLVVSNKSKSVFYCREKINQMHKDFSPLID